MKIERFEDIEAWQLARELTLKVCRLTQRLRKIAILGQPPRESGIFSVHTSVGIVSSNVISGYGKFVA